MFLLLSIFAFFSPPSKPEPTAYVFFQSFRTPFQGKCGPERDIASGLDSKEPTGLRNRQHKTMKERGG